MSSSTLQMRAGLVNPLLIIVLVSLEKVQKVQLQLQNAPGSKLFAGTFMRA